MKHYTMKHYQHLIVWKHFIVWMIFLLLALPLVAGIGIRPAKTTIEADKAPLAASFSDAFWVVNNDLQAFSASIRLEGEMAQYITLRTKELSFREDVEALPVEFDVNLPAEVPAGISTANIVVEQEFSEAGASVSSRIILKHKIIIQGAYPDKYALVKINFHEKGEAIEFVSEVENLGQLDIDKLQTIFYVNDKKQRQQELATEATPLKKSENKLLTATLPKSSFERGEFQVSTVTTYDDQQVEVIKSLVVGEPTVEVTYFDSYFFAHKINQYTLELLNRWNRELQGVFVEVEVEKEGKKVDEFRTKSTDLPALFTQKIQDYYDARDKGPGAYTFHLIVNFWNLVRMDQTKFTFEAELLEEDKAIAAGEAAGFGGSIVNAVLLTLLVVIILVIGGFVGWMYIRRKQEGQRGELNPGQNRGQSREQSPEQRSSPSPPGEQREKW